MLDRYPDFNVKVQNIIIGWRTEQGCASETEATELKESFKSEKAKEEKSRRIKKRK